MDQDALLNLAAFAAQVCGIVGAATLLLSSLRIASAGARYVCWRIVLVTCLVMPLMLQRPAAVESAAGRLTIPGETPVGDSLVVTAAPVASVRPARAQPQESLPWGAIAAVVIGVGAAARAAWLAIGLLRLGALRRRGISVNDDEYAEIQGALGTNAALLSVEGLHQPATFGLRRNVVLLPDSLADSPAALRRAVVTHELFHVQRRDWLWVLAEECLKTVLWFHPAITWLISRIQLAREELVDELTVLATGNRKAYIEALLAFSDAERVRPAAAFARRRYLFTRILRLSKERAMSSPRIVVSAATVILAVVATGWYAGSAFPILSAAPVVAAGKETAPSSTNARPSGTLSRYQVDRLVGYVAGQIGSATAAPTRRSVDAPVAASQGARSGGVPRPGPVAVAPQAPAPGTKPITPENPIPRRLSSVPVPYPAQLRGSGFRANLTVRVTLESSGAISDVRQLSIETAGGDAAAVDARARASEAFVAAAADALRQWRYQPPADPPIAFFVSVRFESEHDALAVQSDSPGGQPWTSTVRFAWDSNAAETLERRLDELMARRAELAQRLPPEHPEAMSLDRQISELAATHEKLVEQLRGFERAATLAQSATALAQAGARGVVGPGSVSGQPVRVGGNIRPPVKTKDVPPAYPEVAKAARVQGVVILEVTIDQQGRVAEARILRSIPLLDQAALDSVRQWEFTPTLLNGSPVPVIMTMTVQFSLPPSAPQ